MNIDRAKEIVQALANGIDPVTGEILPQEHICNNVEVVRAFYLLLEKSDKEKTPENAGKSWSEREDEKLKEMFENGVRKVELQRFFKRSKGSIDARLEKLGLIDKKDHFWDNYRKR